VIRCDLYTVGERRARRCYHILMKLLCAFAAFVATAAFASVNPQLHEVKRVYILAMSANMDQFLANQLAKAGIFEVVTDPKKADAIITDRVGESFESKLDDLYPPPAPPKKEKAEETKPAADATSDSTKPEVKSLRDISSDKLEGLDLTGGYRPSSMGRGKGNIFIVSRASRTVLWSIYQPPKNNTSGELTKTAERVVKHLKEDLTEKKNAAE
jgi:acyl-CoA synthetase (AMP-forming)/AMP-acid ligase II